MGWILAESVAACTGRKVVVVIADDHQIVREGLKRIVMHFEVARASCPCAIMAKACPELVEGMAMPPANESLPQTSQHGKRALDKMSHWTDHLGDLRSVNSCIRPGTGGSMFRLNINIVQCLRSAVEVRVRTFAKASSYFELLQ
jgi:hypothetical protein